MKAIPFKAVAVDMDGTFEDDQRHYDRQEFAHILTQLKKRHIHFIAASGRPAARLAADFTGFTDQVDFVADNGAVLMHANQLIKVHSFSKEAVLTMIKIIAHDHPAALPLTLVSGVKHTYCLNSLPAKRKKMMFFYYPNTVEIDDFQKMPCDQYTKITISYPNTIGTAIVKKYNRLSSQKAEFKTSGFENIDLVLRGIDKASGLKDILRYLKVPSDEVITFGDSGNDVGMLRMTSYSYAMANGTQEAKKAAHFVAPSNNDQGVFKVLASYLVH